MLKDELKLLAQWGARFSSADLLKDPLTATFLTEQASLYKAECIRIKKVWTDLLFSQTRDHVIKRYVSFQQRVIQELADDINGLLARSKDDPTPKDKLHTELAESLLACLLDLRDFQMQYFHAFVNENGKIPDAVLPALRKKITELAGELSATLRATSLDAHLRECILDCLSAMTGAGYLLPVTYREVEYITDFIKKLRLTLALHDDRNLTQSVTALFFHINFNHSAFVQWYKEDLERKISSVNIDDQADMMMKQLLLLKSIPVSTTSSYDPGLPPVNISLETWLLEYIKQLNFPGDFPDAGQSDKLELKLTVAQMALLIRLLYEENVFALKNITALLKFFSVHFTSKKQEHISSGSMNKLYYGNDQFTAYAVRELLQKMVAKVNKMFFPT